MSCPFTKDSYLLNNPCPLPEAVLSNKLFILPESSVIRRLVSLISVAATLEAEKEAAMNQAKSASRAAETLMDSGKGGDSKAVKELETKLKDKEDGALSLASNLLHVNVHLKPFSELRKAKKDVESMKTQAENLAAEYDRVADERNAFERKLKISGGGYDKKDD